MKQFCILLTLALWQIAASAQLPEYPYPVHFIQFEIAGKPVKMAYMDISPVQGNGETILLLHGKNFNGYYWKDVVKFLQLNGFRIIVPDQVGWGKSGKPDISYSFQLLAANTKDLLDSLKIKQITLIGHSMGGMLATRFALMFPQYVDRLIYENPIGLEDYKTFVPAIPIDSEYARELKANYDSLKKYQQGYYPEWKEKYEQYVTAQYEALKIPDFKTATRASALTYQMIYEQPVLYEFENISVPTLIIIGQSDRTIVGKNLLSKEVVAKHGNYPELGKWMHKQIKNSNLIELNGVGHIPHIQAPEDFQKLVLEFLKK